VAQVGSDVSRKQLSEYVYKTLKSGKVRKLTPQNIMNIVDMSMKFHLQHAMKMLAFEPGCFSILDSGNQNHSIKI